MDFPAKCVKLTTNAVCALGARNQIAVRDPNTGRATVRPKGTRRVSGTRCDKNAHTQWHPTAQNLLVRRWTSRGNRVSFPRRFGTHLDILGVEVPQDIFVHSMDDGTRYGH